MNHHIFVRKAYIPSFIPLVPFIYVKKFVVVGGGWRVVGGWVGVKTWILVLSFKPKLNKNKWHIFYNQHEPCNQYSLLFISQILQ